MTEPTRVTSFQDRIAQFQVARDMIRTGMHRWRRFKEVQAAKSRYYISVEEDDHLFNEIQLWLLKDMDPDEQRSLLAETQQDYDYSSDERTSQLRLYADVDFTSEIELDGHTIGVEISSRKVENPKKKKDPLDILDEIATSPSAANQQAMMASYLTKRAIFTMNSLKARDAVVKHLENMLQNMSKRLPSFYTASSYGGWKRQTAVMRRPLDAVILDGDTKERVLADLEKFLSEEERYLHLGLPWHHGYLFHGPPGTGKTSLAQALAGKFSFDVYYIPLSSVESDTKLLECVNGVESKKALLVLEDVDIVHAARDRDDKEKGITLQGLLNALDGIATPHGLITIMTTNDRSVLDPALVRPGRVDMTVDIGYVTDEQLEKLCDRFVGRQIDTPPIRGKITPAEVVGLFKDGDDPTLDARLVNLIITTNMVADGVQTSPTLIR